MTRLDQQGRPKPPLAADETTTLLGFLDFQRATLAWKCAGLDAAHRVVVLTTIVSELARTEAAESLTL